MINTVILIAVSFVFGVVVDHFFGAKVIADAKLEWQKELADVKSRIQTLEAKLPRV